MTTLLTIGVLVIVIPLIGFVLTLYAIRNFRDPEEAYAEHLKELLSRTQEPPEQQS